MNTKRVSILFNALGVPPNFKGYPYLVHIVSLAVSSGRSAPKMIDLYDETGRQFDIAPRLVQDNIRTVLVNYWSKENIRRFSSITHYPVHDQLTIKEFVCIVASYLINHS